MTFIRTTFNVIRTNNSGSPLILGEIVAQPTSSSNEIASCDISSDTEVSRPVGIVTQAGGIANTESGNVLGTAGRTAEIAMVSGLTPTLGEEVIVSTTNGRGTIPESGVGEPSSAGTVVQRIGIINDISSYAGSQRVAVQIDMSLRRLN